MQPNPTTRTVVEDDIPGGLNVFLQDQITVTGPDASAFVDITENKIVDVPVGDEITVAATIENNAATGRGNADSCDGGKGTSLRLVLGGLAVDGPVRGTPECIQDSGVFSGPNVSTAFATATVPDSVGNSQLQVWVEGANSQVRLTPIYGITLDVSDGVDEGEEPPSDDPDNGDGGDDPIEEPPDEPGEFGLGDVTTTCDINAEPPIRPGDTVQVDVQMEGFSPDTNSYEVFVDLIVNGEIEATDSGYVTPNGANDVGFDLTIDEVGEYSIDYNVTSFQQS